MARPTIPELREFFDAQAYPPGPIQLGPGEVLADPAKFVHSHLGVLEVPPLPDAASDTAKAAAQRFKAPYYFRLLALQQYLNSLK